MSDHCDFNAFEKFDVGACLHQLAFGWVPDWVWPLLPYWPWVVVIVGAGVAWRFAGMPGLIAFSGVVGFILGRRSVSPESHEHITGGKDASPPVAKPKKWGRK